MSKELIVQMNAAQPFRSVESDQADAAAATSDGWQPVRYKISHEAASHNLTTSAVPMIRRVAASPRQVKTQIAKVSYSALRPKINKLERRKFNYKQVKKVCVTSHPLKNKVQHTKEEFNKKKDERDKEIQELRGILNEITKKPDDKITDVSVPQDKREVHDDNLQVVPLRKSKTEILDGYGKIIQSRHRETTRSVSTQKRSKSNQPSETKSHELLPAGSGTKRKSYNVQDARKFIEEQKRRRRLQDAKASLNAQRMKAVLEKEQIKKRLEELRKNSRAIVSKNVKKSTARNSSTGVNDTNKSSARDTPKSDTNIAKVFKNNIEYSQVNHCKSNVHDKKNDMTIEIFVRKPEGDYFGKDITIRNEIINSVTHNENESHEENSKFDKTTKFVQTDSLLPLVDAEHNQPVAENEKPIDLLREPELKDHSLSAIKASNSDKENVALENMTPKLEFSGEIPFGVKMPHSKEHEIGNEFLQNKSKPLEPISDFESEDQVIQSKLPTFEGKCEKKVQTTCIFTEEQQSQKENDCNTIKECIDLPYWLKPSTVQIYPYNFIMAVRRKLEAITDTRELRPVKKNEQNKSDDYSQISRTNENTFKKANQNKKDCDYLSSEECFVTHTINNKKNLRQKLVTPAISKNEQQKSQTLSELNTNISSISIGVSKFNSESEISSLKVEKEPSSNRSIKVVTNSGDDTTISSSIFNSPVKNRNPTKIETRDKFENVSPLSLEPVEDLQFTSNLTKAIEFKYVNSERGDGAYKFKCPNIKSQMEHNCKRREINFNQLLDDFNHNLSQVIEVNEQLKTTLSRSHKMFNIDPKSIHVKEYNEYTSDFEDNSSLNGNVEFTEKQHCKDKSNYLQKQSNKFSNPNIIKPVYLKSESLDLELQSMTNSDICSGESNGTNSRSACKNIYSDKQSLISSQVFEKQLHVIEEVKENLKEPIFNSKENKKLVEISCSTKVKNIRTKEPFVEKLNVSKKQCTKPDILEEPKHSELSTETLSSTETVKLSEEMSSRLNKSKTIDLNIAKNISSKEHSKSITKNSQFENINQNKVNNKNSNLLEPLSGHKKALKVTKNEISTQESNFSPTHKISMVENSKGSGHQCVLESDINKQQLPVSSNKPKHNLSIVSLHSESGSESSCSYASVGLFEKLIRKETSKSEQLAVLLKMREKALFDRTKGQIAWLEVQKERCKSKGLLVQMAAIRKKQRGILMKMEKEREEIKRLLQSATTSTSTESSAPSQSHEVTHSQSIQTRTTIAVVTSEGVSNRSANEAALLQKPSGITNSSQKLVTSLPTFVNKIDRSARIPTRYHRSVRANYVLESSRSLEQLLLKRESDLRRRRDQVERLIRWHQQLDEEEANVLEMENALFNYDTCKIKGREIDTPDQKSNCRSDVTLKVSHSTKVQTAHAKMERRLKEIDRSLRELNSVSSSNSNSISNEERSDEIPAPVDFVHTTGSKLNKLWRRLTSQQIEKFKSNQQFKLCKADLERLYEEAKSAVLNDFTQKEGQLASELLEKSVSNVSNVSQNFEVPHLNLNLSSELESESITETSACSPELVKYSPSTAKEKFSLRTNPKIIPSEEILKIKHNFINPTCPNMLPSDVDHIRNHSSIPERNLGLLRSLSDSQLTKIRETMRLSTSMTSLSHHNIKIDKNSSENPVDINKKRNVEENIKEFSISNKSSIMAGSDSESIKANSAIALVSPPKINDDCTSNNSTLEITDKEKSSGSGIYTVVSGEELVTSDRRDSVTEEVSDHIVNTSSNDDSSASCKIFSQNQFEQLQNNFVECEYIIVSNKSKTSYSENFEDNLTGVYSSSGLESIENSFQNVDIGSQNSSIYDSVLKKDESFLSKTFICECNLQSVEIGTKNVYCDVTPVYEKKDIHIEDVSPQSFETISDITQINCNDRSEATELDQRNMLQTNNECIPSNSELLRAVIPPISSSVEVSFLQPPIQGAGTVNSSSSNSTAQLMPDIINELELRRCQQILHENEHLKQFEHVTNMPYMYVREIPNKPPPPYVPPAHGSPMTTIFPSEERIKDITYRRTHELYCKLLKTDYINGKGEKLPSVMEEKITNIYERIILDICREYLEEHHEILTRGDPVNFHSLLAFFNPPDRLGCIQETVYKEVRRCLAMDRTPQKRTQVYSVYGQRAKRDHIGKVIIQEMYDEDDKWCNFHREETEVLELIVDEIINKSIIELTKEMLLEEGGTFEVEQENSNIINLNTAEINDSLDDTLAASSNTESKIEGENS